MEEDISFFYISCYVSFTGHSALLAMTLLNCSVIVLLQSVLNNKQNDALLGVTVWTIGQIGKHSSDHTNAIASANLLPKLLELYQNSSSSHDLRSKCKTCLKYCLQKSLMLSALEPLLYTAPPSILKYILGQYSKVGLINLFYIICGTKLQISRKISLLQNSNI